MPSLVSKPGSSELTNGARQNLGYLREHSWGRRKDHKINVHEFIYGREDTGEGDPFLMLSLPQPLVERENLSRISGNS